MRESSSVPFWRAALPVLAVLGACFAVAAQNDMPGEKPSETEISDVPWTPQPWAGAPKVIYGADDRIDLYQETDGQRQVWAASTCGLINASRLIAQPDGTYTLTPGAYLRFGLPACEDEPFGDQPTGPYCTGFMVGADLIATAGHCSLSSVYFVFGFAMQDAHSPNLVFNANQVYQMAEVVSNSPSGASDHAIVRVDRPITAPGARPFTIRREGSIAVGERIGVIGHPSGLPLKLAFGDQTAVRSGASETFFVANLDTYGGNSGSPVINADTGILEGILVRGDTDYVNTGSCFRSYLNTDTSGRGEDCTRITVVKDFIPQFIGTEGAVALGRTHYACDDLLDIRVTDSDLTGTGMVSVSIGTSGGDSETAALAEEEGEAGTFSGTIPVGGGPVMPGNGEIEAAHGDLIDVTYVDANDGAGHGGVEVTATALVDCLPPVISGVTLAYLGGTQATVRFSTDESARPSLSHGLDCGDVMEGAPGPFRTQHEISLNGLEPETTYYFSVKARDIAGNTASSDNGGACYTFTTPLPVNYLTEVFDSANTVDLRHRMLTLYPTDGAEGYAACLEDADRLPVDPGGGAAVVLADDGFAQLTLAGGAAVRLFGESFGAFFVNANGNVSFESGDVNWRGTAQAHFARRRISMFLTDLNPARRGAVTFLQLPDRAVVTFVDVPSYSSGGLYPPENTHTFQLEMMFDGVLRITWLDLFAVDAVAGLSRGAGTPSDFESINLARLPSCELLDPALAPPHSADQNNSRRIELGELLRVVQFYNSNGYSCLSGSEDGYRPGSSGGTACAAHDSDYAPADWRISLSELLRAVQFYNAQGYFRDPYGEDGFRPKSGE